MLVLPSISCKNSNNSTIRPTYPIDVIIISKSSGIKPQYNNNKDLTCMTDI